MSCPPQPPPAEVAGLLRVRWSLDLTKEVVMCRGKGLGGQFESWCGLKTKEKWQSDAWGAGRGAGEAETTACD